MAAAAFVVGVSYGFELEGAMLDIEVITEALAEPVEYLAAATVGEHCVGRDDVRG